MKKIATLTLALAAAVTAGGVLAQQAAPERRGHGIDRIARLDANGDGRISRDEIGKMPGFADKFAQIDGNKDGWLEASERPQRMRHDGKRGIVERNKRFAEHFATADLNRDGKLSKVEVSEQMPRMTKSFAWLDENRDGFLSRAELKPRSR